MLTFKEKYIMNKTLINGCSFSRGPDSWPYFLTNVNQNNLVNLAQAGAGNTYIHESTVYELSQRNYDSVIIMWSGITRIDFKTSNIDFFKNAIATSLFQHTRNDWPEKVIEPINDQDYVMKDWVFGKGHYCNDSIIIDSKLFEYIYRYVEYEDFVFNFLNRIISLQNTLLQMNIPYIFCFYQAYEKDLELYPELCKLINWDNFMLTPNLNNIKKEIHSYADDGSNPSHPEAHPGLDAHKCFAKHLDNFISRKWYNE